MVVHNDATTWLGHFFLLLGLQIFFEKIWVGGKKRKKVFVFFFLSLPNICVGGQKKTKKQEGHSGPKSLT